MKLRQLKKPEFIKLTILLIGSLALIFFLVDFKNNLHTSAASSYGTNLHDNLIQAGFTSENKDYLLIWETAKWCSLCASSKSVLLDVTSKYSNVLQLIEVDVDEQINLATSLAANKPPLLLLYRKSGELISKLEFHEATTMRDMLTNQLNALVSPANDPGELD